VGSRAFIVDVGNVLLRWSPPDILRSALPPGTDLERYARGIFSHPLWVDLDRGQVDQIGAAKEFASALGISVEEVLRIVRVGEDSLVPLSRGVDLLNELHQQGHDLICLTNMSRETYDHVRPKYQFWNCFRGIVVSADVKMAKPDPAIFQHTLQCHDLDAAAVVFIDDHRANIESARSLGIAAVEYDGSESCLATIREFARLR
jgi:putative hydrolase of the HAD superfamily